jgi:hypothetical protein
MLKQIFRNSPLLTRLNDDSDVHIAGEARLPPELDGDAAYHEVGNLAFGEEAM